MPRILRTLSLSQVLLFAVCAVLLIWGLWSTTRFVMAFNEVKRAHVFPTSAQAMGWQNPERALTQQLPDQAPLGSFTRENAAYIIIAPEPDTRETASGFVDIGTLVPATTTPATMGATSTQPADVTPASDGGGAPTPEAGIPPAVESSVPSEPLIETPPPLPTPEIVPELPPTPPPAETPAPAPTPEPAPAPAPAASDAPQSDAGILRSVERAMLRVARAALVRLVPIATASTTEEVIVIDDVLSQTATSTATSTTVAGTTTAILDAPGASDMEEVPAPVPQAPVADVASCVIAGTPCYTIELSGFGIEGSFTGKKFDSAELRFSFASVSDEALAAGGKLLVRYYFAGRWRQAGEVFLEGEVSNRTNGGYFMAALPDVAAWSDLSDVKVVIEYVGAEDGSAAELYLDAVWIDALYSERAQDILSGEEETAEVPENVELDLSGKNADAALLIMDDGSRIAFPYVDNLREDSLMIRGDRISYRSPGPDQARDVYVSVTNTTDEAEVVRLFLSFPGGEGVVESVARYARNVPVDATSSVRQDVTYFCEAGWQLASSTDVTHTCDASGETHSCTALNDERNNCLVTDVEISVSTSTAYAGAWVPVAVDATPARPRAVSRELPRDYKIAASTGESVSVAPGQTAYFRVTLATPDSVSQRFVISALGRSSFGAFDSLRLRSEESWKVEAKATKRLSRTRLNEQLSTKSDFSVDENPQFRFKFKTQRGFFSRVKDFLVGRDVPFQVREALLTHAGGSIEHVPVDIEYAAGDEWILRLAKPPRAFRPGRYTVELTMEEAGRTYTDTVEFYWGVLAVNPDKWSYAPGETAQFSLAALDDNGNTMCDALLSLAVSMPTGETVDVPVISGGGCGFNNVTDLPDYIAELPLTEPGEYAITASHRNENDEIINETTDAFVVDDAAALSVRRSGPTRIYPVSSYPMTLTLTASQAFRGTVTEVLPEGFVVADAGSARVERDEGTIKLVWDVALDPGQMAVLPYRFKAPEVSPYLYLLGPATAVAQDGMTIFAEGRTWKVASDALAIATGVAWLAGDTTTAGGTNISSTTAYALAWNLSSDYDSTYFTHSTSSNNSQLTVNVAGDYLVAITLPVQRSDTNQTRTTIEADIRINGGKRNVGVGRSAFIRTTSSHSESSDHLYVLLRGLQAGDYIESYVANITTATDAVTISSRASMYVEYIDTAQTVYFGVGTTTTSGDNLNAAATSSMKWYDDPTYGRKDTGYTHSSGSSPENITLDAAGDYLVFVNIPHTGSVTNASIRGRIRLNGFIVPGGDFRQGYIDNTNGATASSIQWSGVVRATTTNTVLTVAMLADAETGTTTIGSDQASIFVQKLPSSDIFLARGTALSGGNDWDVTPAQSVLWATQDIIDTSAYTHSTTSNSHQVTVDQSGDYLLAFNSNVINTANNARSNEIISVLVNGAARAGGVTKTHFVRGNTGGVQHMRASGSFVYLLRDLAANDIVTITTIIEANSGTVTSVGNAMLALWRKQAQSSYIQSVMRWYVNVNGQTPTDPWPAGATDLDESDAITTGNSVKANDVLRLRLAMRANVATVAATDSFKLQYAPGETCTPALSWSDVGSSSASTIWRGYDNAASSSGTTLPSLLLSVSSTTETYEEQALSAAAPNALSADQSGEWDWVIQNNGAPTGTAYCFRVVMSDGQSLKDYEEYPQLVTNAVPEIPTLVKLFDNEKVASTTPWFEFTSSDDNGEDLHYQVQVSSDPNFASTAIDRESQTYYTEFENVNDPSDKSPFFEGQTVRFKPTTALSNNTTYWWRVRAKDQSGTGTWSDWSSSQSFTVDTSVTVSTWFQTTKEQFNTGTLSSVGATSSDDVSISSGSSGTLYSPAISYSLKTTGNSWGSVSWAHTQPGGSSIIYQVEYYTSTSSWALIPNTDLPNNSTGTSTSPISLTSLDPDTYGTIRVRATFTKTGATPRLSDWTVAWALSVAAPTLTKLFGNEKTGTTTPTFQFYSTDPHGDDLVYQIEWSTDATFSSGVTTRTSDANVGFANTASSTDTSPFVSGNTIRFTVQPSDALSNNTTYWWRVRAKDPLGGNAYSLWSESRSFTTDTAVIVSTWFQSTTEQFRTDTLTRTAAASNAVTASSDTGKIAIYRSATAGEAITTTTFNNGWDTTVRQDDIFSLSGTTSVVLKEGYYAVLYGARFDSSSGTNRSEVQSYIDLGGTALPQGWSQGFIRRNGGSNEGYTSGGAVVHAPADNTLLKVRSFRTDTNGTAGVIRVNNTSGVQLIRLDDAWSYARLSKTGKQTGPISSTWVSVTYDRQDELDTTTFGHSAGGSAITLKEAGHYLVFANTYGSLTTNTNTTVNQKLKLDNMDLPGSFTTVYMRGNANSDGDYQGAASIGMIIQSTTTNQVLTVQLSRSLGTASWTINGNQVGSYVDRTGITIVKLPEGDFTRVRESTNPNLNPAGLTALIWNTEDEEDTSFSHSTSSNTSRLGVTASGDYLFLTAGYAAPGTTANAEFNQGWRKNGGTMIQYGQGIGYNATAASYVGAWSGTIFPSLVNGDYVESVTQALGAAGTVAATQKSIQGVHIGSLAQADTNPKTIVSSDIVFSDGTGPKWQEFSWNDTEPGGTSILYQLLYLTASSTYALIPDSALPGNAAGFSTSPVSLSAVSRVTYATLRTQATFTCVGGSCPTLNDWTVKWSEGITVAGTIDAFDQTTDVTSGTVAVAVNGVLQSGKTAAIAGGTWSITNVTAFQDDIVTVFVQSAATTSRAIGITKYDGDGDVTGMQLFERHLSLGSIDNPTLSNTDLSQYDNSISGSSDLFHEVDGGGDLNVCSIGGCTDGRLYIKLGTTFRPNSSSARVVTTPNIQIVGVLVADGNTINVSRSWKNTGTFTKGSSLVVFTATSTTESIDSSVSTSSSFHALTFGSGSGTARWNLISPISASSTVSISYGTLAPGATSTIALGGDLVVGGSGLFAKNTASTTFTGTGTNTWTDNSSPKQDLGDVIIDGTTKVINLGSNVKATDITIGSNDTLDAVSTYTIEVVGNWTNNNTFQARTGTVTFTATTTGKTITPGGSNFYNITFNGTGGNWAFSGTGVTAGNDFTISTGTVTMLSATTTIAGSFDASGGTFMHNNGVLLLTTSGTKTVRPGASSFYDLAFDGSGSWSFPDGNATSSRHTFITLGTVTLPSGALAVGGSFYKNGGSFTAGGNTLRFFATDVQSVRLGGSSAYNLTFAGTGSWSFVDTAATTTGTVRFENGTTTLPSGSFAITGSLLATGGTFAHNNGLVYFNATTTGKTVTPGASPFYDALFGSASGGWTITGNATSTRHLTLSTASTFTVQAGASLAVGGSFTNSVGGAATTWTNSTLSLSSGSAFSINTKTATGDTYGTINVAPGAAVKMWNSSAATSTVASNAYLYSQDHAGVDGDLYIWGAYTAVASEYWAYATDFDGTALGGSSRQVDIRIATGSVISLATSTITGTAAATTTIANQGTGTYALAVTGGTLNASYYQIRHTSAAGLSLSGAPTISSLADGDFELGISGGTLITLASTVIDANPALQIQRVRFATSTGIASGLNVTETGTPSSYWWFRDHYGDIDGEGFDTDPGGDPGFVRWEDSSFVITVGGTVYADHGPGVIGNPPCNGSPVVTILVGSNTYTGSCDAGSGAYSIPGVTFTGDVTVTVYLDTNGGKRAVTVTKTPTANIPDLDLYQSTLIVRHEGVNAMTIADMALKDSTDDSDIFFTAATGSPDTLVTYPETELHVWAGKTFAPGGNVTLQSGGSGAARDGKLHIGASAVFTAAGTQSHSIGGGFQSETGATFTAASTTVTFTATTTGKSIQSAGPLTLYDVVFNGTGGGWSLDSAGTATTTVNSLTLTAGALSGTGDLIVQTGGTTGSGTVTMTGGTVRFDGTGNFGNSNPWQFKHLAIGATGLGTITKTGSATTTVTGVLSIAAGHTLEAGSSTWVLSGGGTPLAVGGTFTVGSAPLWYTATSSTTVADETYASLYLTPAAAGSPTFTLMGGGLVASNLFIGDGTNAVTVTADSNDPSIDVNGDVSIRNAAAFTASNVGSLTVGGSWTNAGTFTHSGAEVVFDAGSTGKTVNAGSSSFYDVRFNNASGGWTITTSATSTRHFTLSAASAFAVQSGVPLAVGGTFTNSVGGAATTWTDSTLFLNSGTGYSFNTKTDSGDTYGTLIIGNATAVRAWNSSAATTTVASGSLYSQDHAGVDGDLYIYGAYTRSSGSDYWSYGTDFDGTDISTTSPRQVDVRIASSSSVTLSGGLLDIVGVSAASTTIEVQGGTGTYAFSVSGGTFNANYYSIRNTNSSGLSFSGTPSIQTLSDGDFELGVNGGSMMTVAGTVINANPLEISMRNRFATSTGIATGTNVTATGSSGSAWKFNLHYGNLASEAYDSDPAGDPGYLIWDDSAAQISISGNVYADEGSTVNAACNGSTQNVRLVVHTTVIATTTCAAGTGAYSFTGISYNPGDSFMVYLNTDGGARAASVSQDPVSTITDMHLYENRVIVRHEDTVPLTILDMTNFDSDQDPDIPFDATDAGTDTLILPPDTKLIVWNSKTFAPAGNITLQSGGSGNAWDGTFEVRTGGTFSLSGTQSHSIGGSFLLGGNTSLVAASSTITFTATTTGKTIALSGQSLYNLTFNGTGGNWAFASSSATSTNDVTITAGTVTLPSDTFAVGGSFENTGGTFMHNNGTLSLSSEATGETIRASGSSFYNLTASSTAGTWAFADTHATSSNTVTVGGGTLTLPSGTLAIGGSFLTLGGAFANNSGTVKMTAAAAGKSVRVGSSPFNNLTFDGVGGAWAFLDANATTTGSFAITNGTTTLPAGTLAVGGSFTNAGIFEHANGTVKMNATATGKTISPGSSSFYDLRIDSSSGGWTVTGSATTTRDFVIAAANAFTVNPSVALAVGGAFTNSVGGAATTWTNSTLYLNSETSFDANLKTDTGDTYGTLLIATSTKVRIWKSSAATTTTVGSGSLYSQDHAGGDGDLYIFGTYTRSSGSDYWSHATDFDGAALGGGARQVDVRIATGSSVSFSGGALAIVGTASATSTIASTGTGTYGFSVSGGTLNANYYQVRGTDTNGLSLSGSVVIASLSYGDFELGVSGGSMLTVAGSVIDANASQQYQGIRFATSSGVSSGYNVTKTGSAAAGWTFVGHYGNYDGEAFDQDGGDSCGNVRWDDSSCLFVSQQHFRWRNDDGGEGAPDSEWMSLSWSKRKKIAISNANATGYSNYPVRVVVEYDGDMQGDFDDLRFTDASGTTTLNYWIESSVVSASSTVWIEVPSLPSSGSATVYMYYGNGSATSSADGSSTFSFFESFESDSLAAYSGDTSLFDTDTTFNYNGSYGLDVGSNVTQFTTSGLYRTGSLTSNDQTIRYYQYVDASQQDEPCTLFGVGGSGSNYAVCLDAYPSQQVSIAKNVTRNDESGTVLATTSVTYATGWYEVVIDWLSSGTRIAVNVYNISGALFATATSSDTTHTSGGMGFSFWGQHGGWDFYTARPYAAVTPTAVFGVEQVSGGATWAAAEDAMLAGLATNQNIRLRFSIQNTGTYISGKLFRLQVAPKGAALSCEAVSYDDYTDVPTTSGGCSTSAACMTTSSQFANQSSTASLLSYPASMAFAAGQVLEDPSNQTSSSTVPAITATEVEYNFQMTNNATASEYCFRVFDGYAATELDNYQNVAEASIQHGPQITDLELNDTMSIALTEGTSTVIVASSTVTDLNGYDDIISATSSIYRSGVGASCTADDNNCYQGATTSCSFSNCAGNSCTLICSASIRYFAEATDASSTYPLENWFATFAVEDSTGARDTETSPVVELLTLYALSVNVGSIDFGSLYVGQDTGAVNATTTFSNTGNAPIDIELAGTDLTAGSDTIDVGEQKFATSTFIYGSCSVCQFLSGAATDVDVNLAKQTATTTPSTDDLYWGLNIPEGTGATTYGGTNTFIAVGS